MLLVLMSAGGLIALVGFVLWCCKRKMTLCLTFDDGLKSHAEIAAPLLEEYGWRGAFNVPVGFIGKSVLDLTHAERQDLCVSADAGAFMTWGEVKGLIAKGHDVYPHAFRHKDIVDLLDAGRFDEATEEVKSAVACFAKAAGVRPRFFCSPHNSESKRAREIIRAQGVGLVNIARLNFGEPLPPSATKSISNHLKTAYYRGRQHVDIMIHGVSRETGGWRPFETTNDFRSFLDEVRALEKSGLIRVVGYGESHVCDDGSERMLETWDWVLRKTRRAVYKVLFWRKLSIG